MKPYSLVPIADCGEPLLPIPEALFAIEQPHPYVKRGAPYGQRSPYYLRRGVLERLKMAQRHLQTHQPTWKIQIFDAYRPIAVQQFMVAATFQELLTAHQLQEDELSDRQRQALLEQVYQFWAVPSLDPRTPPPHSTGAAVDVTLVDSRGQPIDMGSPIDELSERSLPDYYATLATQLNDQVSDQADVNKLTRDRALLYHQHRQVLRNAMLNAGFCQNPNEWWHFSFGDQMWAWLTHPETAPQHLTAQYGAASFNHDK